MRQTEIRIENARSHNLRGVSCRIPLKALTVVTGVSGSGKSSLAFDTLYAEGQRRYVASLSTYARQFLERLPRPEVDRISSLPPAIAIEQRNRVTNARSTVGTATEILDHLRLLFASVGETICPDCRLAVAPGTLAAIADRIAARFAGQRLSLATRLPRQAGEATDRLRERLLQEGFGRILAVDGRVLELAELSQRDLEDAADTGLVLVDRVALRAGPEVAADARLREAVAAAFARGQTELVVVDTQGERVLYRRGFACDGCGRRFPEPEPALFSFDSPLGACPRCHGFGRTAELDLARVVPDPGLSLAGKAIAPFATPIGRSLQRDLMAACKRLRIDTRVPFRDLEAEHKRLVLDGDEGDWYGVRGFFDWLEGRRYKVQARVMIARYRRFERCGDCGGARLCPDALAVEVAGRHLGQVATLSIAELRAWLAQLRFDPPRQQRAERLLATLQARVATALGVGLGYLGLDRQVRTLSGGEAQRIQLATALGGGLTSALYVLDEPSIGLHARDMQRLLQVLWAIRDHGNTVVVVEHAPEIVEVADHVIDLGPGAGRDGGHLVVEGTLANVRAHSESRTGQALRGELPPLQRTRPLASAAGGLRIVGARANNLRDLDVDIPLGCLVVVTGVSGAGKSSLVRSVLVGHLSRDARARGPRRLRSHRGGRRHRGGRGRRSDAGARSPRSNPATVSKAFDGIRQRFAATREARALGVGPGWFSFNVAGGRCEACEGLGEVVIDMQFLDDVRVPCDDCGGLRYRREVLDVRFAGRSIVDVLALTLDEACEVFAGEPRVTSRLEPLRRVGLGYLTLGQPLSTLSGARGSACASRWRSRRGARARSTCSTSRPPVCTPPTCAPAGLPRRADRGRRQRARRRAQPRRHPAGGPRHRHRSRRGSRRGAAGRGRQPGSDRRHRRLPYGGCAPGLAGERFGDSGTALSTRGVSAPIGPA